MKALAQPFPMAVIMRRLGGLILWLTWLGGHRCKHAVPDGFCNRELPEFRSGAGFRFSEISLDGGGKSALYRFGPVPQRGVRTLRTWGGMRWTRAGRLTNVRLRT